MTQDSGKSGADKHMDNKPSFIEHYVPREQGRVYARDYQGAGPAFVLMHGFPDNLHIWDDLIPYLVAGGQRVVTFDFLALVLPTNLPALLTVSTSNSVTWKRSSRCWPLIRSCQSHTILPDLQR